MGGGAEVGNRSEKPRHHSTYASNEKCNRATCHSTYKGVESKATGAFVLSFIYESIMLTVGLCWIAAYDIDL